MAKPHQCAIRDPRGFNVRHFIVHDDFALLFPGERS